MVVGQLAGVMLMCGLWYENWDDIIIMHKHPSVFLYQVKSDLFNDSVKLRHHLIQQNVDIESFKALQERLEEVGRFLNTEPAMKEWV